jgi:4-amino-4-deoxy-L-arabinose transferase-like glycosyltransferase
MNRSTEYVGLALVLLAAVWLRLDNITVQGQYFYDGVWSAGQAESYAAFCRSFRRGPEAVREQVARTGGIWHRTVAKPTHLALLTAGFLALEREWTPLLVNALFGIGTVLIVCLWGRRWRGPVAGLASAALLACLGGHIWYSRSGLAVSSAVFFLTAGGHVLFGGRGCFISGLLLGVGFTSHYFVLPDIVGLLALFWLQRRETRSALLAAAGALVPVLLWQGFYLLRNAAGGIPLDSYFGELREQLFGGSAARPAGMSWQPAFMLRWLWLSSGPASAALLAVGVAAGLAAARWRKAEDRVFALLGPGMLVFWTFASLRYVPVARPVGALLPFLCLLAGGGGAGLLERFPAARRALPAVLLLCLPYAARYTRCVCPQRAAAARLGPGSGGSLVRDSAVLEYYLRDSSWERRSLSEAVASPGRADLVVVDHSIPGDPEAWPDWLKKARTREPEMSFDYAPLDPGLLFLETGQDADIRSLGGRGAYGGWRSIAHNDGMA